jgi:hypothetical protein
VREDGTKLAEIEQRTGRDSQCFLGLAVLLLSGLERGFSPDNRKIDGTKSTPRNNFTVWFQWVERNPTLLKTFVVPGSLISFVRPRPCHLSYSIPSASFYELGTAA